MKPLRVRLGTNRYKCVCAAWPGSTCSAGQCVDQFRAHWVLVYNSTRPLQGAAPVSFAPIEVPSHCECLNVGHP
ncbi:hypothetical protein BaRGS_00021976 [Batillaria attramentaria]|uniref:Uncharacterized protein n=1 Tax=Batillaria attramentaria TaxID=370345 RepID=A0ABD0KI26_9CAEN